MAEERRLTHCALLGCSGLVAVALQGLHVSFLGGITTGPQGLHQESQLPGAEPGLRGLPQEARRPSLAANATGSWAAPVAVLALGAVAAFTLQSRDESRMAMWSKHDRRTFRGKLHGHTFGKYRLRNNKVSADWQSDVFEAERKRWEERMGIKGNQRAFKNWAPPGMETPPELVAACLVGTKINAKDVKALRERSRAGILDCQKALKETDGDMENAMEWLKKKGMAKADKKAGNIAVEGNISSYVHFNNKIAVLVEVNSETDFVASNAIFKEFTNDVAMQIAANPTVNVITVDDVPADLMEAERALEMQKEDLDGKPDQVKGKIVEGRLKKKFEETALMSQKWLKDEEMTVQQALKATIAKLGENLVIRRFVRLNLGEGLEKRDTDFAAGVEQELAKYKTSGEESAPGKNKEPEAPKEAAPEPPAEEKPKVQVSAAQVKELRQRSGAGILDSKKALAETDGDVDKAMEWLKKKGMAKADKKAGNLSVEGVVASYVHFNQKLGVIVEINSETDFVAMNAIFKEFAQDVAMQIAAIPSIQFVSIDDAPAESYNKEKELEMAKEDLAGKPDNIKEKIVEGRLKKKFEENALLGQKWLKDEEKTVQEVLKEKIAKLGENIVIRRFERLTLGEGLDKKEADFAAGVEQELAKYR